MNRIVSKIIIRIAGLKNSIINVGQFSACYIFWTSDGNIRTILLQLLWQYCGYLIAIFLLCHCTIMAMSWQYYGYHIATLGLSHGNIRAIHGNILHVHK